MKFAVDMNLSLQWVDYLGDFGHDAVQPTAAMVVPPLFH
jgi:hypothetical protein